MHTVIPFICPAWPFDTDTKRRHIFIPTIQEEDRGSEVQRHSRNVWFLVLLLFAGAVVGSLAGDILSKVDALKWLGEGLFFPFKFSFDFNFAKLAVDGALKMNIMSLLGIILGIITFMKM